MCIKSEINNFVLKNHTSVNKTNEIRKSRGYAMVWRTNYRLLDILFWKNCKQINSIIANKINAIERYQIQISNLWETGAPCDVIGILPPLVLWRTTNDGYCVWVNVASWLWWARDSDARSGFVLHHGWWMDLWPWFVPERKNHCHYSTLVFVLGSFATRRCLCSADCNWCLQIGNVIDSQIPFIDFWRKQSVAFCDHIMTISFVNGTNKQRI